MCSIKFSKKPCDRCIHPVRKNLWIAALLFLATGILVLADSYDITIRQINTSEQQLLEEQRYAGGMRRFEIEKELKTIRDQRLEIERIRAEALKSAAELRTATLRQTQPQPIVNQNIQQNDAAPAPQSSRRSRTRVDSPPEKNWRTEESAQVAVRGILKKGDRYCALVSGGQIVFSNDLFTTTYKGQTKHWRVTHVDRDRALFQPVTAAGAPLPEPAPSPNPTPLPDPNTTH